MLLVWLSVLTITICPQGDSERLFLTFTKTHITCKMSVSARETLDFSVIFTATYNPSTKQLYATFTQYIDVDIAGLVLSIFLKIIMILCLFLLAVLIGLSIKSVNTLILNDCISILS